MFEGSAKDQRSNHLVARVDIFPSFSLPKVQYSDKII